ncbi:FAD-dependent oxidoreductase [Agromyces laixinhei]|uniref:FAD-dependent oxidoreductase n=1 Tax=Agromyces laixinhei TaxID=2585717 RepID=UPI0012EEC4BC|nr:FAD-dependent oxidoreductase [Agromyces laixinhei]
MAHSNARRALIIGAGIGGLGLACGLAQHGWNVSVAELGNGATAGSGLGFWPHAFTALELLGLRDQVEAIGFDNSVVHVCEADGSLEHVTEKPRVTGNNMPPEFIMARPVLADVLRREAISRGVEIRYNTTFTRVNESDNAVEVQLTDGTTGGYDLLVGADGVNSEIRERLIFPGVRPEPGNGGYFRTLLPESPLVSHGYAFVNDEGIVYIYPAGSGLIYAGIHVKEARGYLDPAATRREFLRVLLSFSSPQTAYMIDQIESADAPTNYREIQRYVISEPARDRIVLVGDAAHSMPPNLSGGGGMAIEDASVLTQMLAKSSRADIPSALQRYGHRRRPRVNRMVNESWAAYNHGPVREIWSRQSRLYSDAVEWLTQAA